MTFRPGDKRPEGAGMKKGQETKRTQMLKDIFEEFKYCPARSLIQKLSSPNVKDELNAMEIAQIELKLMRFIYPEKKAVEHKIDDATDVLSVVLRRVDGSEK